MEYWLLMVLLTLIQKEIFQDHCFRKYIKKMELNKKRLVFGDILQGKIIILILNKKSLLNSL